MAETKKKTGRLTKAEKLVKEAKREEKIAKARKLEEQRDMALRNLQHDEEEAAAAAAEGKKPKRKYRGRRYETMKVKVPYDKTIMNFTSQELINLFGGWFTLTYAFTLPNGKESLYDKEAGTDYYICSRDISAVLPSERPEKNIAIKKLFDKDVYGFALIAPAKMFSGAEEE